MSDGLETDIPLKARVRDENGIRGQVVSRRLHASSGRVLSYGVHWDAQEKGAAETAVLPGEIFAEPVEEVFTVVGLHEPDTYGEEPQRFADEYASVTGWEGAEAAAQEEHPTLQIAAVLKCENGSVKVCDVL